VQAESAASCAALAKSSLGVAVPPLDAAKVAVDSAVADTKNPPLYGRPCVMLALRENELVTVGDSGASKHTGNLKLNLKLKNISMMSRTCHALINFSSRAWVNLSRLIRFVVHT
jgi:hypothetical protein